MASELDPNQVPVHLREVEATGRSVTLSVWRGDASGGGLVDYEVPVQEGMVVLDAVLWVQAHVAGDLALRWNCKAAKCGSCSAEVNGFPRLMCKSRLDEYGGRISVKPMHAFPVIKDLVTDVSWNYEVNRRIPPFTPSEHDLNEPQPWRMQQEDVDRVIEFRKCIECFLCQDVCHVLRNHDGKDAYYGPRFMVRMATLEMHPKDSLDRTPMLKGSAGIGLCNITKCCQEVCPEHIHITDNAIIPLKERMVGGFFDPVAIAARKLGISLERAAHDRTRHVVGRNQGRCPELLLPHRALQRAHRTTARRLDAAHATPARNCAGCAAANMPRPAGGLPDGFTLC